MSSMTSAHEPPRPLGQEGRRCWDEYAEHVSNREALLLLAETLDERALLRPRVLRGDTDDRAALRSLEARINDLRDQVQRDAAWQTYSR